MMMIQFSEKITRAVSHILEDEDHKFYCTKALTRNTLSTHPHLDLRSSIAHVDIGNNRYQLYVWGHTNVAVQLIEGIAHTSRTHSLGSYSLEDPDCFDKIADAIRKDSTRIILGIPRQIDFK